MQIKVSDYIVKYLEDYGVRLVFMISGGGAMHLNDSFGASREIRYFCNHHEQASAFGAEGYARISGKLGVVVVTTGPGGTNTITGVMGQWTDSVPVLYISGQVKQETMASSYPSLGLRQLGDQEINIIDIVRPITKFCATVRDPREIKRLLEQAIAAATSERPGPVWLEVPLDVQSALIDTDSLTSCKEDEGSRQILSGKIEAALDAVLPLWQKAERPVVVAGHGIRLAGAQERLMELLSKLSLPVVTTFNGCDLIPSNHPCYIGRIGTIGDRAGNLAVQNSDFLLCLGTRNNIRQISYNGKAFARCAARIVVDIDPAELHKPTMPPALAVQADVGEFLLLLNKRTDGLGGDKWRPWLEWCKKKQQKYPVVDETKPFPRDGVHPHYFAKTLSRLLPDEQVVVTGNGTVSIAWYQAAEIKNGQRALWNSGCAAMGYDLPAAIGAALAVGKKKSVICLAGDGSLQMNLQELGTVFFHQLPIKIFVFNNRGYFSIQQTQKNFFSGREVASGPQSGVGIPDFCAIARAYQLPARRIEWQENLAQQLESFLQQEGPALCEVMITDEFEFGPKVASLAKPDGRLVSQPLENMWPFLPREEYLANLLIPEWNE